MESKYENLCAALRACEAEAAFRTTKTKEGPRCVVAGTIPMTMHAGRDNSQQVHYSAWFLGRGRGLCLESAEMHRLPADHKFRSRPRLSEAIDYANGTGFWVTRFSLVGNGVKARAATMLPTDRSMEGTVRELVDDFIRAIDSCHLIFAAASHEGIFQPRLLDDRSFVFGLLRAKLEHTHDEDEDSDEDSDEDVDDSEEDEDVDDSEEDEDVDEPRVPRASSRRIPQSAPGPLAGHLEHRPDK